MYERKKGWREERSHMKKSGCFPFLIYLQWTRTPSIFPALPLSRPLFLSLSLTLRIRRVKCNCALRTRLENLVATSKIRSPPLHQSLFPLPPLQYLSLNCLIFFHIYWHLFPNFICGLFPSAHAFPQAFICNIFLPSTLFHSLRLFVSQSIHLFHALEFYLYAYVCIYNSIFVSLTLS